MDEMIKEEERKKFYTDMSQVSFFDEINILYIYIFIYDDLHVRGSTLSARNEAPASLLLQSLWLGMKWQGLSECMHIAYTSTKVPSSKPHLQARILKTIPCIL